MKPSLTISSTDLKAFDSQIRKYGKRVEDSLFKEVVRSTRNVASGALRNTPRDTSYLSSGYRSNADKTKMTGFVSNDVEYAPYVEFGTGSGVANYKWFDHFDGLREKALEFKGKGLRKINRIGKGMLYSAAFREIPKFQNNIQKLLKKEWHR